MAGSRTGGEETFTQGTLLLRITDRTPDPVGRNNMHNCVAVLPNVLPKRKWVSGS